MERSVLGKTNDQLGDKPIIGIRKTIPFPKDNLYFGKRCLLFVFNARDVRCHKGGFGVK